MRSLIIPILAALVWTSCNQIQQQAVDYMNVAVTAKDQLSNAVNEFAIKLNEGELDAAEANLREMGRVIDHQLIRMDSLGIFNGDDSTLFNATVDFGLYLRDTAFYHFNDWLGYKRLGTVDSSEYLFLKENSPVIQDRIMDYEAGFNTAQEDFADKYEIELEQGIGE